MRTDGVGTAEEDGTEISLRERASGNRIVSKWVFRETQCGLSLQDKEKRYRADSEDATYVQYLGYTMPLSSQFNIWCKTRSREWVLEWL